MILSDRSIKDHIKNKKIIFEPPIADNDFSPSSVDVHLGNYVYKFKKVHSAILQSIDLKNPKVAEVLEQLTDRIEISSNGYDLSPLEFILAYTKEKITLPSMVAARLEGRSTLARFGITVHSTAPTVQPFFSGPLMLEVCNLGETPCNLKQGLAIAQLIFEHLDSEPLSTGLDSVWQKQRPTTLKPRKKKNRNYPINLCTALFAITLTRRLNPANLLVV